MTRRRAVVLVTIFIVGALGGCSSSTPRLPPVPITTTTGPTAQVLNHSGDGSGLTPTFTIKGPAWQVQWNFQCTSRAAFSYSVQQGGSTTSDQGADKHAAGGSGIEHYTDDGTFRLMVQTARHCTWDVFILQNT
jgi:hypothetical protein